MSTFPGYFKQYRLHVGQTYLVCDGSRIREAKLIRTTGRGFNFENCETGKNMFKKHLYPMEADRELLDLTFQIIGGITIDNKI
jgi:hypothetical protein